ncbi:unnamed protein product [Arctia plantaginis]|uniref:Major facilitator superfamily (MFS) profile domain-containing protein n=1 Tax=Arctia plantaginis TaxID=874455 RepID=A0A8S1AYM7_ARCPL|nr:unnamed protein product [Arctia plantaginis]
MVMKSNTEGKQFRPAEKEVTYDDLLSSVGQLGIYQWRLFFSTCPFFAFGVFAYFSQMFITEVSPNHWCRIPELENMTAIERRDLGVPKDNTSRFGYSQCTMYVTNWTAVLEKGQKLNRTWKTVPCRYGWEFNKSEIPYPTIGSDLEWVCEKDSYQATAQAIFFIGCIAGGFFFGWIADRFGRLPAIIGSCLAGCVGGLASTFTKNLGEFAAARFVMGMAYDSCTNISYLLLLEYIGPKYRTLLANLTFALFFCLFMTVLPWVALACGNWKVFSLVTSLPLALSLLAKLFLPESPMWLISKGRVNEAIEKVIIISKINKKEIPTEKINQFRLQASSVTQDNLQNLSWWEIFKRPLVKKMYILTGLEYMCTALLYDGLVRSIGQLDFNFFVSFSLISFTEFPSVLIVAFIMDYIGRRWMCIVVMSIGTIFCFLVPFVSGVLSLVFAVIARFAVNMGFSAAMQWAPEVLPTSVRGSGVSVIHICAFVSTFLSPYIVYLKVYYYWLPFVVMSGISGLATIIPFFLPETAMKAMPNTFEESEELTKNQRLRQLPYLESKKQNSQKDKTNEGVECQS